MDIDGEILVLMLDEAAKLTSDSSGDAIADWSAASTDECDRVGALLATRLRPPSPTARALIPRQLTS